jgi:hypothetical protein
MTHRFRVSVLALLLLVALAVAACGPTATPAAVSPTSTEAAPATEAAPPATPERDSTPGDDWRSKGAADAPVLIEEYSDFQ